jgi:hypothetical protein
MSDPRAEFEVWFETFWNPGSAVVTFTPDDLRRGIELLDRLRESRDEPSEVVLGMLVDYHEHLRRRGLFVRPKRSEILRTLPYPDASFARIAAVFAPSLRATLERSERATRAHADVVGTVVEFLPNSPKRGQGTIVLRRADGRLVDLNGPLDLVRGVYPSNVPGATLWFNDNGIGITVRLRPRAEVRGKDSHEPSARLK